MAGWFDVFQQGSIDNYVESRKQGLTSRLIVGPWEHASNATLTPGCLGDVNYGLGSLPPALTEPSPESNWTGSTTTSPANPRTLPTNPG
ncbi:hypothetical protein EU244_028160 [Rhodococcus qingshengii]|uniref:hypothetical protein n=1 Tax=Rhodococcus qingshengii TaxID=334542 RepID=UPI003ECC1899